MIPSKTLVIGTGNRPSNFTPKTVKFLFWPSALCTFSFTTVPEENVRNSYYFYYKFELLHHAFPLLFPSWWRCGWVCHVEFWLVPILSVSTQSSSCKWMRRSPHGLAPSVTSLLLLSCSPLMGKELEACSDSSHCCSAVYLFNTLCILLWTDVTCLCVEAILGKLFKLLQCWSVLRNWQRLTFFCETFECFAWL